MSVRTGETKGYEYEKVGVPWLEKKVEMCADHLRKNKELNFEYSFLQFLQEFRIQFPFKTIKKV